MALNIPSVEQIVRCTLGALAALIAVVPVWYVMVVLTYILSWLLAILAMGAAGYFTYQYASGAGYDWLIDRSARIIAPLRRNNIAA